MYLKQIQMLTGETVSGPNLITVRSTELVVHSV